MADATPSPSLSQIREQEDYQLTQQQQQAPKDDLLRRLQGGLVPPQELKSIIDTASAWNSFIGTTAQTSKKSKRVAKK